MDVLIFNFLKWYPELVHFCPDVPFILVGTKLDCRKESGEIEKLAAQGQAPITTEQGMELAKKLKAVKVETFSISRHQLTAMVVYGMFCKNTGGTKRCVW
jgi:GTPase SAR1 family protein